MKYLLMIYANQQTWAGLTPQDWSDAIADQNAFNHEFFDTGELIAAYGLADAETAKVVRVRPPSAATTSAPGRPAVTVTDGAYLEAREYLASSYLLDVANEQRALDIAARMPFASWRAVEVWPVMHEAGPDLATGDA